MNLKYFYIKNLFILLKTLNLIITRAKVIRSFIKRKRYQIIKYQKSKNEHRI